MENPRPKPSVLLRLFLLPVVTFVISFVFINWFLGSQDIDRMPTDQMWTPSWVLLFVTGMCALLMPRVPLVVFPFAILGIAMGVVFDALTDTQRDRNLFPIEMLIWTGFAMPGIVVGSILGSLLCWVRLRLIRREVVSEQ